MPNFKEIALCYKKMPFGVMAFDQLEIEDKGTMIDEALCHNLCLPIRNFEYRQFTLAHGVVTRVVGHLKILIWRGKLGETVPFNAKVVRNLSNILGVDAVSGKHLSEKLADIPAKPANTKENIQNWVHKHWESTSKAPSTKTTRAPSTVASRAPSTAATETTYPPGTSSTRPCRCDWSNVAAHSQTSTKCCGHLGLCQDCSSKFDDIKHDIADSNDNQDDVLLEDQQDVPQEELALFFGLQGSYEDDYGPSSEELDSSYERGIDDRCDASVEEHALLHGLRGSPSSSELQSSYKCDIDDRRAIPAEDLVLLHGLHGSYEEDYGCSDSPYAEESDEEVNPDHQTILPFLDPGPASSDKDSRSYYDRHNDIFVSKEYFESALKFRYDLSTNSVDQSRNSNVIQQLFQREEEENLFRLALQYGYDIRTGAVD